MESFAQTEELHGAALSQTTSIGSRLARNNEKWESLKSAIHNIYIIENKNLSTTMHTVEVEHGFKASVRKWKDKLKEWKFDKYLTENEKSFIVAKAKKRKACEDKETVFYHRGNVVTKEKLGRVKKRKGDVTDHYSAASPIPDTPSNIIYSTPKSHEDLGCPKVMEPQSTAIEIPKFDNNARLPTFADDQSHFSSSDLQFPLVFPNESAQFLPQNVFPVPNFTNGNQPILCDAPTSVPSHLFPNNFGGDPPPSFQPLQNGAAESNQDAYKFSSSRERNLAIREDTSELDTASLSSSTWNNRSSFRESQIFGPQEIFVHGETEVLNYQVSDEQQSPKFLLEEFSTQLQLGRKLTVAGRYDEAIHIFSSFFILSLRNGWPTGDDSIIILSNIQYYYKFKKGRTDVFKSTVDDEILFMIEEIQETVLRIEYRPRSRQRLGIAILSHYYSLSMDMGSSEALFLATLRTYSRQLFHGIPVLLRKAAMYGLYSEHLRNSEKLYEQQYPGGLRLLRKGFQVDNVYSLVDQIRYLLLSCKILSGLKAHGQQLSEHYLLEGLAAESIWRMPASSFADLMVEGHASEVISAWERGWNKEKDEMKRRRI